MEWTEFEGNQKKQEKVIRNERASIMFASNCTLDLDTIIVSTATISKSAKGRIRYCIIARNVRDEIITIWALVDPKRCEKNTTEAEAIRYALIKAKLEG